MGRPHDPARAARERLQTLEARDRANVEARAVADGVAESVRLSRRRGAAFDKASAKGGVRETPYRRQTGLEWLAGKGRISERQKAAGEAYGERWRRAGQAAAIGSTWEMQPGGGAAGPGPTLGLVLKMAAGRARAEAELSAMRARLFGQSDLVSVCDLVCGQELTPREAGGPNGAARIEAVLKVALDILLVS